jgi:hypothetical protein
MAPLTVWRSLSLLSHINAKLSADINHTQPTAKPRKNIPALLIFLSP